MNIPQLRFNEFDGEWEKILFEDIFFEKTERTNDMSQYPLFSLTVEKGVTPKTDRYERSFLVKEGNDNYKIVNPDDFVYNPMNLTLGAVAKHKKNINISVSGYYNVFSTNPKFNSDFLEMYLKSYKMILHYKAIATGSLIEKQRVHFSQFVKIKRPIPSIIEQNKIGSFFAKLDQRIEKQQEKIEKLEQFKKGMMHKIFSQELRFKDEDGGEFEEWKETTFGEVSISMQYGMNSAAKEFDGENKYIRITDIDESSRRYIESGKVSPLGNLSEEYRIKSGDILFARTGASTGKSYLYKESDGKMYYAGFLIRLRVRDGVDSRFVYYQTLLKEYDQWVKVMSMRSGQPGINAQEYSSYKFNLPRIEEQIRIADFLDGIENKIEKEREKLRVLEEQKKGFMQGMFI